MLSSGAAPVLLIAGWSIAAALRGPDYDPVNQTISVPAAYGTPGFWVMTGALLALGVCHLLTAWGLRAAATAGRVALGAGGVPAWAAVLLPAPWSVSYCRRCGRCWRWMASGPLRGVCVLCRVWS
jgi:hypothetical protein